VYFCCLEALQNAAKHSEASRVAVRLWREPGRLAFSVADDGRGFDPAQTSMGTGVQGMADRIAALGGTLELRSSPGVGTTVTGRIPHGNNSEGHRPEQATLSAPPKAGHDEYWRSA